MLDISISVPPEVSPAKAKLGSIRRRKENRRIFMAIAIDVFSKVYHLLPNNGGLQN